MLPHNVAFYLPSQDKHGQDLPMVDRLKIASFVRHKLVDKFGGCTEYDARGYWLDDAGETVSESVLIIRSFCESPPSTGWCESIAEHIRESTNQETVAYEINGALLLGPER